MTGKRIRDDEGVGGDGRTGGSNKRRHRTRRALESHAGPAVAYTFTRPTNGLPTPEPSSLTESQRTVAASDEPSNPKEMFPFLKLPAELRVHVYRMALQRDEPLLLHLQRPDEKSDDLPDDIRETLVLSRRRRKGETGSATNGDHVNAALLRTCSLVYKEAHQVLYADNTFTLALSSGVHTLSALHQRSRSLIKSVSLVIPSHHDILDAFADLVRLGLRYCWGLKIFNIILDVMFSDDRMMYGAATSVYANAFHILRWLPKGCKVVLEGNVSEVVRKVVAEEGRLQEELDEASYLKRQHQMMERH